MHAGTTQLQQQAIFRPTPGLGRPETPIAGLYLASASAHPGGGVHGGPGAIAARAALAGDLRRRISSPGAARRG
jgi:phytoene dehydrogenase-like protein